MKTTLVKAILAVGTLAVFAGAQEEEQGRGVARISVIDGEVSVSRGDSGEWIAAAINAPLMTDDRLFCGPQSRAEVQFDFANMIRVGENSEVRLSELEPQRYQVQIGRGIVMFRVLRDSRSDVELSTPSVSVRPIKRGSYRVTVREDGASEITVRSGEVEVYTPRGAERLTAGRTMLARGTASDPEYQIVAAIRTDDWDRWNERRDQDLERTRSYEYVSTDIYGAEDLDGNGEWVDAPGYGWVWAPRVAVDWAPYRYGRWSWIDWYGWNWVSYDPWGWAPYHYGRWFNYGNRWCWWPGARHTRHYWSPAQVAFFGWGGHGGGIGIGIGFGNVGWVPLAPHETFHPWYGKRYYSGYRDRTYVDNSVHVVNNINITNVYRNARVNNGITAVNAGDFTRGRAGNRVRVSEAELRGAGLVRGQVPLTPAHESLRMADREVRSGAVPGASGNGRFVTRRQPAKVDRVTFDDQRRGMDQLSRRTFGEPGTSGNAAGGRVANVEGRAPGANRTATEPASGWRRAETPAQPGASAAPSRGEATDTNRWRRFEGTGRVAERPAGTDRQRPESAPRLETPGRTRGDTSVGSRREAAPRTESPRYQERNTEPMRINTPIVRERPNPGSEGRGGYSRAPESRPQVSAPPPQRSAPQVSAPAPRGGSGSSRGGGEVRGGGSPRSGGGGRSDARSSGRSR